MQQKSNTPPRPKVTDKDEINRLRRLAAQNDPDATRRLCEMSNTPVPEWAHRS